MGTYTLPLGRIAEHEHPHPERTARKLASSGIFADYLFRVWPNRKAMATTIRMQQRRAPRMDDWRPIVPLTDGEGY
ncbi:MAG: hypothetical protein P1P84_02835 [Deferrisomatales bacterium]|nr:hypothetical protein [Deferrisomatales bacterium]